MASASIDAEITALLAGFSEPIRALALELVSFIQDAEPDFEAKARFGWLSVNFRHPRAGFVCAVFPYVDRVCLVFEHGRQLDNRTGLLEGNGSQVRFARFEPNSALPRDDIAVLLAEAIALRA